MEHRILRSRTKYVGTGLANIFGERTPCKKLADLHPRHGNLLQRNKFSFHKIGWRPAEKNRPFFNMRVLYLDFYGMEEKVSRREERSKTNRSRKFFSESHFGGGSQRKLPPRKAPKAVVGFSIQIFEIFSAFTRFLKMERYVELAILKWYVKLAILKRYGQLDILNRYVKLAF
jgi:hypothetical protein